MIKVLVKRTLLGASIAGILGLTGCGGGSSSGSEEDGFTSSTIAGTAAKGIVQAGLVTAVELGSDQAVLRTLGTTTTGADGSYELTIPSTYTGNPIKVSVTSDVNTQMKCDAAAGCGTRTDDVEDTDTTVDFGEWYKPGADKITLNALVPNSNSGDNSTVNITPFTNLATTRALESATLDATAVEKANSEVTALLGMNILDTKPADITDSAGANADQIAYAALSAAIANLATVDENGAPDIESALANLAQSFAGGKITATDDGSDKTAISLQDIIDGAQETFTAAGIEQDTSGHLAAMQDDVSNVGEDGYINPEPADTATLSNVEKAKAFIEDFRTYATALQTTVENPEFGGEFKKQVGLAVDTATVLDGPENPVALLDLTRDFISFGITIDSGTMVFTESDYPFTSGTVTVDPNNGTYTFTNAVAGNQTVNLTFVDVEDVTCTGTETGTYPNTSGTSNCSGSYKFDLSGSIVGPFTSLTIKDGEVSTGNSDNLYSYTNNGETATASDEDLVKETFDYDMTVEYVYKESADAMPVTFSGNMQSSVLMRSEYSSYYSNNFTTGVYTDAFNENIYSFVKSMALNGSIVYGDESIELTANASQPNAETFFNADSFTETADSWLQASAGLTLNVNMQDLSDVTLNLSASRTALDRAQAKLSLSHGDRSLSVSFENPIAPTGDSNSAEMSNSFAQYMGLTVGEPENGVITVTNLDGASMTFKPNGNEVGTLGSVMIDGQAFATVERTDDGLIKTSYNDGTFEIF